MARARAQNPPPARQAPRTRPTAPDEPFAVQAGEFLRRAALGLITALIVARAYWTPENAADGTGSAWIVAVILAAALAIAGALCAGSIRLRISWVDLAVLALVTLVAFSSAHAHDRRPALNLAWEWIAIGITYVLVRNLPANRAESSAIAGCLIATAIALSAYGLVQAAIEFPEMHRDFEQNPKSMLRQAGLDPNLDPNSPEFRHFRDRVVGSNEVFATFALANSLAGFLVGPIVLGLAIALDRLCDRGQKPPIAALLLAAVPFLILTACLILTKSRSAYLGLLVGVGIVLAQSARSIPRRWIAWGLAGTVIVGLALTAAAAATGHLDLLVLTESTKSFRYRLEYWKGTAALLADGRNWWSGVGPGNFGNAYLKFKLPQSSEEILDPHNMLLDVWVSSGLLALIALVAALGLAARDVFGRPRITPGISNGDAIDANPDAGTRTAWLIACGFGGWILAWPLGGLHPFGGLETRWLVLGGTWAACWLFIGPLIRRGPIPAWGLGAAAAALAIHLLAAGGIGYPSVAVALWVPIALGLNLRDDRRCGQLAERGGHALGFVVASILAGLFGWFWGSVLAPTWTTARMLGDARAARDRQPPNLALARRLFHDAADRDQYDPNPWIELAAFDLMAADASREPPSDRETLHIANHLASAHEPPRNPNNYRVLVSHDQMLTILLQRLGTMADPATAANLKKQRLEVLKRSSALYPTNTRLRARFALGLAEAGDFPAAISQAREALRIDLLTPHAEKKLPDRDKLEADVRRWETLAAQANPK